MAKARTTTDEIVKNENVTGAAEATEGEATASEATAETPKNDGRVEVFVPTHLLTEEDYVEVGYNGRMYQVMCGVSVRVPKGVAEILENSIAQKKKVEAMKKKRSSKSVELRSE